MLQGQRGAYQRALSMDAKPMCGEGPVAGGLATRRNAPCPTLVKQETIDVPIRPGAMPNGFSGGMGVCPPRGNPTSNLNTYTLTPSILFSSLCTLNRQHGNILTSVNSPSSKVLISRELH